MKQIKIGNHIFKIIKGQKAKSLARRYFYKDAEFLDDVYKSYSSRKEGIYNYWRKFYEENNCNHFTITSYNANVFTLAMLYTENHYEKDLDKFIQNNYILYITPTFNYAINVKEVE